MTKCLQISVVAICAFTASAIYQNDDAPATEEEPSSSFIGDIIGALPFAGGKKGCGLFSCDGGLDLEDFDEYLKQQKNESDDADKKSDEL
jgi:hypothetical protein